ncbi:hypothetical protein T06_6783 [Trichinella sp. T6]|nr:hypothetical protein T06_6783 [Trichinella sp. T6]
MDCDLNARLSRSGRIIQELIVLPDADISEPEMDSDDDQRSFSVVECSAELASVDEETDTFRRAEFSTSETFLSNLTSMPPSNAIENLTCSSAAVFDVLVYGTAVLSQ